MTEGAPSRPASPIVVRVARPDDAAAVTRVLQASYPALMAASYDQATLERTLPLMTRANPALLASGTYYIVKIEDETVGCGGWTIEEPGTGNVAAGVGHIRHFGVVAAWSGQGVGRALYERCAGDARQAGLSRFECFSSLNGASFYAALGFVFVRHVAVRMGKDLEFPSVHMTRMI